MSIALASMTRRAASNFAQAVRALHVAPVVLVGLAVYSCVAMGSVPAAWLQRQATDWADAPATSMDLSAPARGIAIEVPSADVSRSRRRCADCGVVQSIERIEASGETPATYRFSIRLYDGTQRTSTSARPDSWRIGDRVLLIAGATAATH